MAGELVFNDIKCINIYDENVSPVAGILTLSSHGFVFATNTASTQFKHYIPYALVQNVLTYAREDDNFQKSQDPNVSSLISSLNSLRSTSTSYDKSNEMMVQCKNFWSLMFYCENAVVMKEIACEIQKRSVITEYSMLPCFQLSKKEDPNNFDFGWTIFNIKSEYNRMCIEPHRWIQTSINEGFKLCSSYPEILYVPVGMTNNIIYGSSKFRSKQRFPVLCYYHEISKAAICRSSQPLAGLTKKCKEDILLLQSIAKASRNANQLVIVDTRPKINALANKAKGKGFEDIKNYPFCKFYFSGIENIHVMRDSSQKLFQAIYSNHDSYISFITAVENTGWMKHIKAILDSSIFICHTILSGTNVLVHCSDGWDRTSQTCALASLFLDPFYRTIHGFIILIEKDFLSFGHRFSSRCQHLAGDSKNVSAIFLQFLDCVWQVMRQFPSSFQFNELFLITIAKHVYSCEYGTFMYNSLCERLKNEVSKNTESLWSIGMEQFHNPLMDWSKTGKVITPQTSKDHLKLWADCYASGLNFPNIVDSRMLMFDSLAELKNYQRAYPSKINESNKKWQHPTSETQKCNCGELFCYHNQNFQLHCWNCYQIGCTKCIQSGYSLSEPTKICSNCSNDVKLLSQLNNISINDGDSQPNEKT